MAGSPLPTMEVVDLPAVNVCSGFGVLSSQVCIGAGVVPPAPSVCYSAVPTIFSIIVPVPG